MSSKLSYEEILASVAFHSVSKHLSKFKDPQYGPTLDIGSRNNQPQGMANFLADVLHHEDTQFLYSRQTIRGQNADSLLIYNRELNIYMPLTQSSKYGDAGSVYRIKNPNQIREGVTNFDRKVSQYAQNLADQGQQILQVRKEAGLPSGLRRQVPAMAVAKYAEENFFDPTVINKIRNPRGDIAPILKPLSAHISEGIIDSTTKYLSPGAARTTVGLLKPLLDDIRPLVSAARGLKSVSKFVGLGSIFTVGLSISMTETAHAAHMDIADKLLHEDILSQEEYNDYKNMMNRVRNYNRGQALDVSPASMLTAVAVEQHAKEEFDAFFNRHDLEPELYDILTPSMITGLPLRTVVRNGIFDALPDDGSSPSHILQPLSDAKHAVLNAQEKYNAARGELSDSLEDRTRTGIGTINANSSARDKLESAEEAFNQELITLLSARQGIRAVSNFLSEDDAFNVVKTIAQYSRKGTLHPLVQEYVDAQQAQVIWAAKGPVFREANPTGYNREANRLQQNLNDAEQALRNNNHAMRTFVENTLTRWNARAEAEHSMHSFAETLEAEDIQDSHQESSLPANLLTSDYSLLDTFASNSSLPSTESNASIENNSSLGLQA